jgi:hypothetical protein
MWNESFMRDQHTHKYTSRTSHNERERERERDDHRLEDVRRATSINRSIREDKQQTCQQDSFSSLFLI